MKIGIVTLYNSSNYGSQLQALALMRYLSSYATDISFIQYRKMDREIHLIKDIIYSLIKMDIGRLKFCFRRYKGIKQNKIYLPICTKRKEYFDYCIFGSDEIWNIRRKRIQHTPMFWGKKIRTGKKIAYAISINNTDENIINKSKSFKNGIMDFEHISVRDQYSCTVLSKFISKNIFVCVDPTLLLKRDWVKDLEKDIDEHDYILIYAYNIPETEATWCINYAKKNHLKMISIGNYFKWCDECVPGDIFEFLGYMNSAKYVFTNTFHGTIFSIIYHKNFVSFGKQKKVYEILVQLNLEERYITDNISMSKMYNNIINYDKVDIIIERLRIQSQKYLELVLGVNKLKLQEIQ